MGEPWEKVRISAEIYGVPILPMQQKRIRISYCSVMGNRLFSGVDYTTQNSPLRPNMINHLPTVYRRAISLFLNWS